MAEARGRDNWQRTSAVLALLANIHRDPKRSGLFKPDDFNPYTRRRPARLGKGSITVLKDVFVRPQKKEKSK